MYAGGTPEELGHCIERLRALRKEYGRESEPFEIHASSLDGYKVDGVRRLSDQGITDLVVGFRNPYTTSQDAQSLADKLDALRRYADKVIAKF